MPFSLFLPQFLQYFLLQQATAVRSRNFFCGNSHKWIKKLIGLQNTNSNYQTCTIIRLQTKHFHAQQEATITVVWSRQIKIKIKTHNTKINHWQSHERGCIGCMGGPLSFTLYWPSIHCLHIWRLMHSRTRPPSNWIECNCKLGRESNH